MLCIHLTLILEVKMRFESRTYTILDNSKMRKQFAQKWQLKSSFAGFKLFSARQIRIGSGHSLFSFVGENFIRVSARSEGNKCQSFQWISYHYKHVHSAGQVIINISIKSIFLKFTFKFHIKTFVFFDF